MLWAWTQCLPPLSVGDLPGPAVWLGGGPAAWGPSATIRAGVVLFLTWTWARFPQPPDGPRRGAHPIVTRVHLPQPSNLEGKPREVVSTTANQHTHRRKGGKKA